MVLHNVSFPRADRTDLVRSGRLFSESQVATARARVSAHYSTVPPPCKTSRNTLFQYAAPSTGLKTVRMFPKRSMTPNVPVTRTEERENGRKETEERGRSSFPRAL